MGPHMSSPNPLPVSDTLLANVEQFIETYYEYRKSHPQYKGFFGKLHAYLDRAEAERQKGVGLGGEGRYFEPWISYSEPPSPEQVARDKLHTLLEQSFGIALMKLIEDKGRDHVEVYKRAGIDRKLFSKIRTQHNYIPNKKTVIALTIALELSFDEAQQLLHKAGFSLSRSILFDVIIEYFLRQGIYDIFEINSVLYAYEEIPLD